MNEIIPHQKNKEKNTNKKTKEAPGEKSNKLIWVS
jgi:hypothetical protein